MEDMNDDQNNRRTSVARKERSAGKSMVPSAIQTLAKTK